MSNFDTMKGIKIHRVLPVDLELEFRFTQNYMLQANSLCEYSFIMYFKSKKSKIKLKKINSATLFVVLINVTLIKLIVI